MNLTFIKLEKYNYPSNNYTKVAYLSTDNWDDFGHKTLFSLVIFDENGTKYDIGNVKIGYKNQPEGWTKDLIPPSFNSLADTFFFTGARF